MQLHRLTACFQVDDCIFFGFFAEENTKPDNDVAAAVAMSAAEVPNLDTPMPEAHAPLAPAMEDEAHEVSAFLDRGAHVCW